MSNKGSKAQPAPPSGTGHFRRRFRDFDAIFSGRGKTTAPARRTGPPRAAGPKPPADRRLQALLLGLPLYLASCGPQPAAKNAPESPRLTIAIEAPASSLDPRFASDANGSRISGLVHCSLVEAGRDGGWQPSLASSWEQPDPTTWEFRLRPDARFHDSRPVGVADVLATYRAVLDPATASPKKAALDSVLRVEQAGSDRVRFVLNRPDAAFLEGATIGILPRDLATGGRLGPKSQPGCGPYRVAESDDDRVVLTASRHWYGGAITLPSVEFRVVPDAVMRTLQLQGGSIHLVQNALEPDAVDYLASHADHLRVTRTPYDAFQYLGINHRHPALADVRVRRALAHAIDREGIVRHLLGGQAEPASGLLPPHHRFHSSNGRTYAFDPARARRLLDRAGYPDPDGDGPRPRMALRYSTSTVELRRRIAEVVAANLADVGIAVTIESYEWGTFFADIAGGDYDLYSLAWIGIHDPDLLRVVFHSAMTPPAGNNRAFFSHPRVDRLTGRGRAETDPARRRAIYAKVQRTLARTLPCVPLWWPDNVVVMSTRLEDFDPHPSGELSALTRARLRPQP